MSDPQRPAVTLNRAFVSARKGASPAEYSHMWPQTTCRRFRRFRAAVVPARRLRLGPGPAPRDLINCRYPPPRENTMNGSREFWAIIAVGATLLGTTLWSNAGLEARLTERMDRMETRLTERIDGTVWMRGFAASRSPSANSTPG